MASIPLLPIPGGPVEAQGGPQSGIPQSPDLIGDVVNGLMPGVNQMADAQVQDQAKKQAVIDQMAAGATRSFDTGSNDTIYARAYNDSANTIFVAAKQKEYDIASSKLYDQYKYEPDKLTPALDALKASSLSNVPLDQQGAMASDFDRLNAGHVVNSNTSSLILANNGAAATLIEKRETANNIASAIVQQDGLAAAQKNPAYIQAQQDIAVSNAKLGDVNRPGGPLLGPDSPTKIAEWKQQQEAQTTSANIRHGYDAAGAGLTDPADIKAAQADYLTDVAKNPLKYDPRGTLSVAERNGMLGGLWQEHKFSDASLAAETADDKINVQRAIDAYHGGDNAQQDVLLGMMNKYSGTDTGIKIFDALTHPGLPSDGASLTIPALQQKFADLQKQMVTASPGAGPGGQSQKPSISLTDSDATPPARGTPNYATALEMKALGTYIQARQSASANGSQIQLASMSNWQLKPAAARIDMSANNAAATLQQQRFPGASTVSQLYGEAVPALQAPEIKQLASLPVDQQQQIFGSIALLPDGSPGVDGKPTYDIKGATISMIAKTDPTLATAAGYIASPDPDTRAVGSKMLVGAQAIKNGTAILPDKKAMEESIQVQLQKAGMPSDLGQTNVRATVDGIEAIIAADNTKNVAKSRTAVANTTSSNDSGFSNIDDMTGSATAEFLRLKDNNIRNIQTTNGVPVGHNLDPRMSGGDAEDYFHSLGYGQFAIPNSADVFAQQNVGEPLHVASGALPDNIRPVTAQQIVSNGHLEWAGKLDGWFIKYPTPGGGYTTLLGANNQPFVFNSKDSVDAYMAQRGTNSPIPGGL